MNRIAVVSLLTVLASAQVGTTPTSLAGEAMKVDLTKWTAPDIASVGDDPFGKLVKYGHALVSDTANQIGPNAPDPAKRFTRNNLNCQSCHLQAGTQPYAMPLTGIWGQFPQYRGLRELEQDIIKKVNKTGHLPLRPVSRKSIKRPLRDFLNGAML